MFSAAGHLANGDSGASIFYLRRLLLQRLRQIPVVLSPRARMWQDAKAQQSREGLMNTMCKSALQFKSWCDLRFSSTASPRLHAGRLHELEMIELASSPKDCKDAFREVVVHLMSGKTLEMKLPEDATIRHVKEQVRRTWGIAHVMQSMVFGEAVLPNSTAVDSLDSGYLDQSLALTLILSLSDLRDAHRIVVAKIRRERTHATNTRSVAKLVHYLEERDELEEALKVMALREDEPCTNQVHALPW